MAERKTLLKRYEIPLDHLDFAYVNKCNDAREMERIVHVLQSGEEGYFPDLTKCAEDKLRQLKPNSRLFRCEEQLRHQGDVNANEVKPIYEFSKKVRTLDQRLAACSENLDNLPPLRQPCTISLNGKDKKTESSATKVSSTADSAETDKSVKRISSTDYRKWDEYDPDVEILRMDLEEERIQEEVERKNRLNTSKSKNVPLITEIKQEEERFKKLTDIELNTLAEEHRLRGNDYYRSKDYKEALLEYTKAIAINPDREAAAYNNRALTNIKLKNFKEAINDCEKCLSIEPNNVKAMYRLAESSMQNGLKEKAFEMFSKVLEIEPNNVNAKNFIEYLRLQIGEKPPANATRLLITDESKSSTKIKSKDQQNEAIEAKNNKNLGNATIKKQSNANVKKTETNPSSTVKNESIKDYDLSALIRPKEIIPNKVMDTAANMFKKVMPLKTADEVGGAEKNMKNDSKPKEADEETFQLRMPTTMDQNYKPKRDKPLIEEI